MIYAMADIHGCYDKYISMLEKIRFGSGDSLFVLGDVIDRGPEPIKVVRDMMDRVNVFPIMGNHECAGFVVLRRLMAEITEENVDTQLDAALMGGLAEWIANGGDVTLRQFQKLSADERALVLDYIGGFPLYDCVETDAGIFVLVHAGLGDFREGKKLSQYTVEQLAFVRPDFERRYYADESVHIVTGHTPTELIWGRAEIYKSHGNVCIDCGAVFPNGRLGCLCLDTMEEFYV